MRLAKCLVLDGSYRFHPVHRGDYHDAISLSPLPEDKGKVDYMYSNDGNAVAILHPMIRQLHIEENRLARRIALQLLYESAGLKMEDVFERAHFPRDPLERELNGLNASEYVAHNVMNGVSFLTTAGRELYESNPWGSDNLVFVIAACHADAAPEEDNHQKIISEYRRVLDEHHFRPIFQEHEEPEKNIYVDIFEYLDTCEFVVADISYDRPNCYVEIGYALARGKHVVGFMQKEYFNNKRLEPGQSKIPFDLFPIRFQEYPKGDAKKLRELLEKRIGVVKKRRAA